MKTQELTQKERTTISKILNTIQHPEQRALACRKKGIRIVMAYSKENTIIAGSTQNSDYYGRPEVRIAIGHAEGRQYSAIFPWKKVC